MTPGIALEGRRGTVEIISAELMTGKEWKERIKSYEGSGSQVHKPGDNERLWVINYTCQARNAGRKVGEYHRVLLWKAFDVRTGDFEYFRGESLEEAKPEPLTLNFEISFVSNPKNLAAENLGTLKGDLTLENLGGGKYRRRLEISWSDERPDEHFDISFDRFCWSFFLPKGVGIPAPPQAYKVLYLSDGDRVIFPENLGVGKHPENKVFFYHFSIGDMTINNIHRNEKWVSENNYKILPERGGLGGFSIDQIPGTSKEVSRTVRLKWVTAYPKRGEN